MDHIWATIDRRDAIDDHLANPRGESLANLSIVFVCLSSGFVGARLATRWFRGRLLGIDDALIVAALLLAVCMTVTYNEEARFGFGLHKDQVDAGHRTTAFKWFFAAQILYKVATCCTKLSIGTMYLRIFPAPKFRIAVYVVMGVTVAYTLAAVMLTVFSCNPIRKAWDKGLDGTCLDSRKIWYSTSIMIILTDVMIIILPIIEIRHLQLPLLKKFLLGCLFSLGVFVIACTIIRMVTVSPKTTATDQIYYQATSNSWTFVETNVAIWCACLPVLRVPLTQSVRRMLGLSNKATTIHSDSTRPYGLGTIGQINSRRRTENADVEGDSVEDLIVVDNSGIKMTRGFSVQMTSRELQEKPEVPGRQYPAWKVGSDVS